ncbi:MAG: FHA domain-containing protein [Blastocatellia bacterium]
MIQLWLKFKDEKNEEVRKLVEGEKFIVGRHSASNLSIPDSRLSREHAKIERFGDFFVISDLGSSNGTKLNGKDLSDPVAIKDGDILSLGGVEVTVIAESDEPPLDAAEPSSDTPESNQNTSAASASSAPAEAGNKNLRIGLLLTIPILGIFILIFAGGLIYMLSGNSKRDVVQTSDDPIISEDEPEDDDTPAKTPATTPGTSSTNPITIQPQTDSGPVLPQPPSETAKIEQNGAVFLRRIAQNDPKAFLTTDQAQRVNTRVKQLGGSSALADNINSARKNADRIKSLAAAKNLKPQFLAVAAISKLGNNRGDIVQTATAMSEVLDKLGTQIGNEFAEDSLLMIAAYDQGVAGDTMKMRNMLQDLSNKFPESTRAIRTIWFLQKNGKITQAEFDQALNFLAVGTITQNPKEFGVNAEALVL